MFKYQKGFTVVEGLLIVLVLAVVGFGGYYVWNQNKDKQNSQSTPSAVSNNQAAQTSESNEPVKNTYTSKLYPDLSFDLPKNWEVSEPKDYEDPSWPDGILTLSDGKSSLKLEFTTAKVTGFEGYTCYQYQDVTEVGEVYRYIREGVTSYRNGITSKDEDWSDSEKDFYVFEDPKPNYCVSFPFIGTYSSKQKQADYPDKTYGFADNDKVLVWLSADIEGTVNDAVLKDTDSIIISLSDSVKIN